MPEPLANFKLEEMNSLWMQAAIVVFCVVAGRLLYFFIIRMLARLKATSGIVDHLLIRMDSAMKWLIFWCSLEVAFPFISMDPLWTVRTTHLLDVLIIANVGWLLTGTTLAASQWLNTRYSWSDTEDNLRNRSINTQLRVFTHVIVFIIWLLTAIAIIMTVPHLRSIGVSLFASAGVAGIVIGMAAGPTLSNLIAGIQLALTQPIRIGDQIVIEGVSGIVEEIDSTYVVVKLWDMRRLIVPLNYFIQNRFQNWTHTSGAVILGTVEFFVDYTMPVEPLRAEFMRVVKSFPAWSGNVAKLQVTDIKDNKMVGLKASFSTAHVGHVYPLQCEIREKLLDFIQKTVAIAK